MAPFKEYTDFSAEAAKRGGPNKYIGIIKEVAYNKGVSDTTNRLVAPLLIVGSVVGAGAVVTYTKIKKWVLNKKEEKLILEQKATEAEELLKKELDIMSEDTIENESEE